MSNIYPISAARAIGIYEFPQEFIDFLNLFSPPFKSIFENEMKLMVKEAFFEKTSQLASYQIFTGKLRLEQLPGRKQFLEFYK